MEENFDTNLMRMIAANTSALLLLQISQDLFGKAYLSLSDVERSSVDSAFHNLGSSLYSWIHPDLFPKMESGSRMGFRSPADRSSHK